jgi:hypothetical protein
MTRAAWIPLSLALLVPAAARAQVLGNLSANWSDTVNPNVGAYGTWSYLTGTTPLPHVPDWTPLGASTPQPAWAPGTTPGNEFPAEFKATSAQALGGPPGWQVGDIIVRTTDQNSISTVAELNWTSPIAGTATVSGSVFEGSVDIGRDTKWLLAVNGLTVTSGVLTAGDGHDRSNPMLFRDGAGGPSSLVIPNVTTGTTFDLLLTKTTTSPTGDYVGVEYQVSVAPVPEPSLCLTVAACVTLAAGGGGRPGSWRPRPLTSSRPTPSSQAATS